MTDELSLDIAAVLADARSAIDEMANELLERGGNPETVRARVARIFPALYQLARLDAAFTDRRRREAMQLAELVGTEYRAGVTVKQLAERHRRSERRIYALLEEFDVTHDTTRCLAPPGTDRTDP